MQSRVIQRQRVMEENLYTSGRQKSEVLCETKRHTSALETGMKELRAAEEIAQAHREARQEEWTAAQKSQTAAVTKHSKGLLDLEKGLHRRTMERTMGRVVQHLKTTEIDTPRNATNYLSSVGNGVVTHNSPAFSVPGRNFAHR